MTDNENTAGMPMPQPKMPASKAPSPAGATQPSGSTIGGSGPAAGAASAASPGASSQRPADSWAEVVRSLDDLATAVTGWAGAMRDDPDNRRRVKQLQQQLENVGHQIGEAADAAAKSDFVKQVGEAAATTGEAVFDTAKRFSGQVAPYISSTLQTAAEGIRDAAKRVDEKAAAREGAGTSEAPTVTPAYPREEGSAPSPSVEPDE